MVRKITHRIGIPLALASASLLFCWLVLELGLRIVGFDPMSQLVEGRGLILQESSDPVRVYELRPNASGFAWRTKVQVNSYGMRDREYPVERTDAPRILVAGDSVTFGSGVSQEERFSDQLEGRLQERLGRPVEVLNLGVGGYDALQTVATIEDVGVDFSPDLVVLAYCINDAGDNSPNLDYIRRLESVDPRIYQIRTVQLAYVLTDKVKFMLRLRAGNRDDRFAARFAGQIASVSGDPDFDALRAELQARQEETGDDDYRVAWYSSDAHLGKVAFAFDRLADLAGSHGFEVIVAILPALTESRTYPVIYRMVEHMASREGFDTTILEPFLAPAGLESLRLEERDDIHPDARGHALIAEGLAPILAEKIAGEGAKLGTTAAAVATPH